MIIWFSDQHSVFTWRRSWAALQGTCSFCTEGNQPKQGVLNNFALPLVCALYNPLTVCWCEDRKPSTQEKTFACSWWYLLHTYQVSLQSYDAHIYSVSFHAVLTKYESGTSTTSFMLTLTHRWLIQELRTLFEIWRWYFLVILSGLKQTATHLALLAGVCNLCQCPGELSCRHEWSLNDKWLLQPADASG